MLRDGRLSTPNAHSMCGIQLDIGKVYIIAGRMPQLNLCSYYKEYTKMTIAERHGFSGAYGMACNCTVSRTSIIPLFTSIDSVFLHRSRRALACSVCDNVSTPMAASGRRTASASGIIPPVCPTTFAPATATFSDAAGDARSYTKSA